jgi:hypothetical protein
MTRFYQTYIVRMPLNPRKFYLHSTETKSAQPDAQNKFPHEAAEADSAISANSKGKRRAESPSNPSTEVVMDPNWRDDCSPTEWQFTPILEKKPLKIYKDTLRNSQHLLNQFWDPTSATGDYIARSFPLKLATDL